MMHLDRTLSELARLRSGNEPIVSLYLDVRWRDEQQRDRVRLFVQEGARSTLARYAEGTPGRDALARTLTRLQAFVAGLTAQAYEADRDGLALFACEAIALWRPLFYGRAFANELAVDATPHLGKLARLAGAVVPAIVAVPSREGADVYEVRLGKIDLEGNVRGVVPRNDSEKFNPESWALRNRRAAAEEVTALFDRTPRARVLLVGTAETVAAFERELPERVAHRVVARVPRPRSWDSADGIRRDGVKALAEAAVLGSGHEEEEREVNVAIGEALRGGRAVVGPEDVVLAVNEGRVQTLFIEEDLARAGFSCANCNALGASVERAEVCPFCGGELRAVAHLGEALVARTLAEGGRVEVVPRDNKLHSYDGIAAFLRQTAPTGLRGASQGSTAPRADQP